MDHEYLQALDYVFNFRFVDADLHSLRRGNLRALPVLWRAGRWRAGRVRIPAGPIRNGGADVRLTLTDAIGGLAALPRTRDAVGKAVELNLEQPEAGEPARRLFLDRLSETVRRHPARVALTGFYLHGSQAMGPRTPFSDVDDLVVIRRDALDSVEGAIGVLDLLYETALLYYAHDRYQHHRHFVITDDVLRAYDESFLPIAALKRARVVWGASTLKCHVVENPGHVLEAVERSLAFFAWCRETGYRHVRNAFAFKDYLSALLLLPAQLLALAGDFRFKGDTFQPAGTVLARLPWTAIEEASAYRRDWPSASTPLETTIARACLDGLRNAPAYELLMRRFSDPVVVVPTFFEHVEQFLAAARHLIRDLSARYQIA